jgi:hypothetical protein
MFVDKCVRNGVGNGIGSDVPMCLVVTASQAVSNRNGKIDKRVAGFESVLCIPSMFVRCSAVGSDLSRGASSDSKFLLPSFRMQ